MFYIFNCFLELLCSDVLPVQRYCIPVNGYNCHLDEPIQAVCHVNNNISCSGSRSFTKTIPCRFCYQVPESNYICQNAQLCYPSFSPVPTRCYSQVPCIDNPMFYKMRLCKRSTRSHKIAILLSLTLGYFGVDRFYLGYIISGIFKLLTCGGLGIGYLVDFTLILFGGLGPYNGFYEERFE